MIPDESIIPFWVVRAGPPGQAEPLIGTVNSNDEAELLKAALQPVGQMVLNRWPVEDWVRGTVAGSSRTDGFSHVVWYSRTCALGATAVPLLLSQQTQLLL